MASQIAHIVYAKKFLENDHPSWINKDEFILGCVFPDIRLIDKDISRKDTHMRFPEIDLNFEGLTSFEAGWKFHLYCDMKREEILSNHNFFKIAGDNLFGRPNKLLEDKLIYSEYNNWEKICLLMNNVPYFKTGIDVSRETFEHWYAVCANYMKEVPNDKSIHIFASKMLGLASKADEIVEEVKKIEENKEAVKILENIKEEII